MLRTRSFSFLLILFPLLVGCPGDDPVDAIPGSDTGTSSDAGSGTDASTDTTGSTDPSTGGAAACVPGQTISCTCTGADVGVQVCLPDGSGYGPCECEATDDTSSTGQTEGTDTGGVCGDGVIDPGEDCDDGGESAACNEDCTLAVCGDAVLNATAGEDCDDGGESATCNVDCTPAVCGDGILNATAGEHCDDAGRTAACDVDCTPGGCGDGWLNVMAGEDCDDGGESATCNADCSLSSCGDGITNLTAGEDCDDAGPSAACDDDCTAALCGDLVLNPLAGEQCEGAELDGASCQSLGFDDGTVACDAGCTYDTSGCFVPLGVPVLDLSFSPIKQFDFSWAAVAGATDYQILESPSPGDPFIHLGTDLVGTSISIPMPLHFRHEASYVLRACNAGGCVDSAAVSVVSSLAEAVGYFKASNTDAGDRFGVSVALSGDGSTLAVGAMREDGSAAGIGGDQASDALLDAGAVYVFVQDGMGGWTQQAYVKASNPGAGDRFGETVTLSDDGSTLAVGAPYEDSSATGIDGDQASNAAPNSGAVYVFVRNGMGTWSQQAYVKASNTDPEDFFGIVALSGDGNTLAVGALNEDSDTIGIDGDEANAGAPLSGATYVFVRDGMGTWSQQAYVKASNTGASDHFGASVSLAGDGDTLAVGAWGEDGYSAGIDGDQTSNLASSAGAAYVFVRDGMGTWSQQAYVKASTPDGSDYFGSSMALSADGNTLAVGAPYESSPATGIDGDQSNDAASDSGAAYVFVRDGVGTWSQQVFIKASNTDPNDLFAWSLALSADGSTLAVGAIREGSNAIGLEGNQANDTVPEAGAAYVLVRDGMGTWSQRTYVKAPNPDADDWFGRVSLSADGSILAVGAFYEDGNATGIDGDQANDAAVDAGAVYLY